MRRAINKRALETDCTVDLDEEGVLQGEHEYSEIGGSRVLSTAIEDVCSGGSTVGRAMRNIKAHVQDAGGFHLSKMTRKLGTMSAKNSSRDWWRKICGGPAISYINLPVKYLDSDGRPTVKVEPWPIMDIHDTLSFLFNEAGLEIPQQSLREYWEHAKAFNEPWAQEVTSEEMDIMIPIGFYGDSARVDTRFGSEHVLCFFMNVVLWRPRSVRWSRFLVLAIEEERLTTETIPAILRRVVWSLNHAFCGFYPEEGHLGQNLEGDALRKAGQPLTRQRVRFQCTELRGDWSFHKKLWRFSQNTHWNGENVCHLCPAKGIGASWSDLYWNLETPAFTDFSLVQFLAERIPARKVCPLIALRRFHPSCIRWCLMHVLHLGILYTINGGAMHMLLRSGCWGHADEPVQTRLHRAYLDFKLWCSTNRVQCSQPAFQQKFLYQRNGDVMLICKAYNGRVVLQWLSERLATAAQEDGADQVDDRIKPTAVCALHLARWILKIEKAGRYLTEEEAESIFAEGFEFLRMYKRLAAVSIRKGLQEFFIRPKIHAMWHLLKSCRHQRTNPRFWHCFCDEDAMAWAKRTFLKGHPQHRMKWVVKCGRARIWATKLKIQQMNREVRGKLHRGRG